MTKDEFRAIRKSLVLTQAGMARYLGGVSIRTVVDWERGVNGIPKPVVLLMTLYRCFPKWMMKAVRMFIK